MLYVQKKGSRVWHFHPSCLHFQEYEDDPEAWKRERADRPTAGEVCAVCRVKERRERSARY